MVISLKCNKSDFDWKTNKIKLLTCIELFNDNSILLQTKNEILNSLQKLNSRTLYIENHNCDFKTFIEKFTDKLKLLGVLESCISNAINNAKREYFEYRDGTSFLEKLINCEYLSEHLFYRKEKELFDACGVKNPSKTLIAQVTREAYKILNSERNEHYDDSVNSFISTIAGEGQYLVKHKKLLDLVNESSKNESNLVGTTNKGKQIYLTSAYKDNSYIDNVRVDINYCTNRIQEFSTSYDYFTVKLGEDKVTYSSLINEFYKWKFKRKYLKNIEELIDRYFGCSEFPNKNYTGSSVKSFPNFYYVTQYIDDPNRYFNPFNPNITIAENGNIHNRYINFSNAISSILDSLENPNVVNIEDLISNLIKLDLKSSIQHAKRLFISNDYNIKLDVYKKFTLSNSYDKVPIFNAIQRISKLIQALICCKFYHKKTKGLLNNLDEKALRELGNISEAFKNKNSMEYSKNHLISGLVKNNRTLNKLENVLFNICINDLEDKEESVQYYVRQNIDCIIENRIDIITDLINKPLLHTLELLTISKPNIEEPEDVENIIKATTYHYRYDVYLKVLDFIKEMSGCPDDCDDENILNNMNYCAKISYNLLLLINVVLIKSMIENILCSLFILLKDLPNCENLNISFNYPCFVDSMKLASLKDVLWKNCYQDFSHTSDLIFDIDKIEDSQSPSNTSNNNDNDNDKDVKYLKEKFNLQLNDVKRLFSTFPMLNKNSSDKCCNIIKEVFSKRNKPLVKPSTLEDRYKVLNNCFMVFNEIMIDNSFCLDILRNMKLNNRNSVVNLPYWAFEVASIKDHKVDSIFKHLDFRKFYFDNITGYLKIRTPSKLEDSFVFFENTFYIHESGYVVSCNGCIKSDENFVKKLNNY